MPKHKVKFTLSHQRLYLVPVVLLVAVVGTLLLLSTHAASCTVSAQLVNSCRPWLAAYANQYPEVAGTLKAQTEYHEQRIGRQLDVVHDYRPPGSYSLSADDVYFAQRANTTLLVNWKPADPWVQGAGGNTTINADIDNMADSIKAVGAHKVMLTLYHEPEDNVTSDPNCALPGDSSSHYKGSSGTPTDYRNMWANVRSRFDAKGVTNVVWVMNYMGYVPSWSCIFNDMWPGNNLVDWVLYDPYISTSGFSAGISPFYNFMTNNSTAAHDYASKPWGLNEWGAMTSLTQPQAETVYDQAKAVVDNNTFPKLKLYDVFDTIGGGDFRVGYSVAGAVDQTEQSHYNGFADDPHFTDSFYVSSTDTQPPQVSLSAPSNTASVSGTVTVSANASDNVAVSKVEIYVDGGLKASLTSSPYSFSWDTTKVANGSHSVYAIAYDASGNKTTSSTVTVTVNNQTADTSPPTVSIVTPTSGTTAAGTVAVSGNATDNVGIASVALDVDGTPVASSKASTSPYSFDVDTTKYTDGAHSLLMQAYDAANNVGKSNTLTLNVANTIALPSVPTGLTASVISSNQVNLSWASNTPAVAGYYVERNGVVIKQVAGNSFSDTTTAANTTYSYSIVAYNTAGASKPSSAVNVTTPAVADTTPPTIPNNLAVQVVSSTQTNLSWSPSTDNIAVAGYYILRNNVRIATVTGATSFGDASGSPGASYAYAVRAFDAAGNRSDIASAPSVTTQPAGPTVTNGLAATYFSNSSLTGVGVNRTDSTVNFDWGYGAPMSGLPVDNFSTRWSGRIYAQTTGTYTFYTTTDDGARLTVNGNNLINDWNTHGAKLNSATVTFTAGQWYNINLEYFESTGLASAVLAWSGPGISQSVVPSSALATASYGLTGSYYQGTNLNNLVLSRADSAVNYNWGYGAPDAQLPVDGFSVRWTGKIIAPATGTYTFYTNTDDGSRLTVGGALIINQWTDHGLREYSGNISLTGGQAYTITMDYYENTLLANAQLLWSGPSITKEIVPSTVILDR